MDSRFKRKAVREWAVGAGLMMLGFGAVGSGGREKEGEEGIEDPQPGG